MSAQSSAGPSVNALNVSPTRLQCLNQPEPRTAILDAHLCLHPLRYVARDTKMYVRGDAVERDGGQLLRLAKATVTLDNALRGRVPPALNGTVSPLSEHARTLRVFAELLRNRISEGRPSEELEAAVLRDGKALLRLALCCLEFDQAVRGLDSA